MCSVCVEKIYIPQVLAIFRTNWKLGPPKNHRLMTPGGVYQSENPYSGENNPYLSNLYIFCTGSNRWTSTRQLLWELSWANLFCYYLFFQGPAVVRMSKIGDFCELNMLYMLHVTCFSDFNSVDNYASWLPILADMYLLGFQLSTYLAKTPTAIERDRPNINNWCYRLLLTKLVNTSMIQPAREARAQRACALRALGLLLADGAPTVGGGKTFWAVSRIFLRKQL